MLCEKVGSLEAELGVHPKVDRKRRKVLAQILLT